MPNHPTRSNFQLVGLDELEKPIGFVCRESTARFENMLSMRVRQQTQPHFQQQKDHRFAGTDSGDPGA